MKRLSIIIPMYNVEPYIERCIRSLEDQDIPKNEYEIICINDGSPDNSKIVVQKMQNEFSNIILIDQTNGGVSVARNNGIDLAHGKYLLMVDPDDYVMPNSFKRCLEMMDSLLLEVGSTGYIILNEHFQEEYRLDSFFDSESVISGIDYFDKYLRGRSEIRDPHRSWAVFFKTDFINSYKLRYTPGVPYLEDGELMARIICLAQRVIFINEPFYFRTTRSGSATHSKLFNSEKARRGFLMAANNLQQFKLNYCSSNKQMVFMNQPIIHFTILYLVSLEGFKYLKCYSQLVNSLKRGSLKKLNTEGCSNFYKKMGNYYNISIHCFFLNWLIFIFIRSLKMKVSSIYSIRLTK